MSIRVHLIGSVRSDKMLETNAHVGFKSQSSAWPKCEITSCHVIKSKMRIFAILRPSSNCDQELVLQSIKITSAKLPSNWSQNVGRILPDMRVGRKM